MSGKLTCHHLKAYFLNTCDIIFPTSDNLFLNLSSNISIIQNIPLLKNQNDRQAFEMKSFLIEK